MALYPTLSDVGYLQISQEMDQKILTSNFDDLGKTQVKRKWLYPKRNIMLDYSNILNAALRTIEQFYIDRYGGYSIFTFIMPPDETNDYDGEYIGTLDASTIAFNMPCKAASGIKIYIDGNLQTVTANYAITVSGGQDGVDLCTLTDAGTAGSRLTCDFTGALAVRCRFKDKINWSRTKAATGYNSFKIELVGSLMDE